MQIDQGFADVNGTQIYYEIAGSGHPLVLIHGFTLDTRMWDDQFEGFATHHQAIRYDVRGFGKSALPTEASYDHTDDLYALMQHLGIDSAYILGLSMGGRIAIDFALTYPTATDALIPVDAGLSGFQFKEFSLVFIWQTAKESGLQEAKTAWLNHPILEVARQNGSVNSRMIQMVKDYSGWHWFNDDPRRALQPPAIERLDEIETPTLAIVGERDILDCHRIADLLEERITCAKKIVMPGVGHMSNMEAPERFNEIVLGFLAEVA